jgi:hypothetical protein
MNWLKIETRPDEGEFLAWDPVARKQDVCRATMENIYADVRLDFTRDPFLSRREKIGQRKSCEAAQMDGEFGPDDDEFRGDRATHWAPLLPPPIDED